MTVPSILTPTPDKNLRESPSPPLIPGTDLRYINNEYRLVLFGPCGGSHRLNTEEARALGEWLSARYGKGTST
jgi:hypothetical protein